MCSLNGIITKYEWWMLGEFIVLTNVAIYLTELLRLPKMMRLFTGEQKQQADRIKNEMDHYYEDRYNNMQEERLSQRSSKCEEQESGIGSNLLQFSYDVENPQKVDALSLISEESGNESVEEAWSLFD